MAKEMGDDYVTVPTAASRLGKTKVTLYRWIEKGEINAVTFGGVMFIHKDEVERKKTEGQEKAAVEPAA